MSNTEQTMTGNQHTILIIDDDPNVIKLLQLILSQYESVLCASNAKQALSLIQAHASPSDIHLILTDQRMPEMSGTELLSQIKTLLPHAKRMLMTAYQDISVMMTAINELDIYQVILKPFEINEVMLKVRRALECFEYERQQEKLIADLYSTNHALALSQNNIHNMIQRQSNTEMLASLGGLVAHISYEIDTPLGLSITTTSFLEEKTRELISRAKEMNLSKEFMLNYQNIAYESCRVISRNIEKAINVLHAFKEFSIDLTQDEARHLNLKSYIDDILLTLLPGLKHSKHELIIHCPDNIVLVSYPGAITKILTGLINYSLNYAYDKHQAGTMTLDAKRVEDNIVIVFTDNGKFVDKATFASFFRPLHALEDIKHDNWLGLSAVNQLVTQTLGGRLDYKSTRGHGTEFIVTLPVNHLL